MLYIIELLKNVFLEIIKNSWEPIYTNIVKIAVVSLVIWLICNYIGHGIPALTQVSYLGWMTLLTVYRLFTYKFDDATELKDDELLPSPDENTEPIEPNLGNDDEIEDRVKNVLSPKELKEIKNDNTSTRE
jgi:hypothetical protein